MQTHTQQKRLFALVLIAMTSLATLTILARVTEAGASPQREVNSLTMAPTNSPFLPAMHYSSGGVAPKSVAIADLNGDGKPDLVVANDCTDVTCSGGGVAVLLGNGDGTFRTAVSYSSGGVQATSVAVADVNGDGNLDIVVANCSSFGPNACNGGAEDGTVDVLLGNGDGTFRPRSSADSAGMDAISVAVADVNGDGKPDILVGNSIAPGGGSVGVLLGNGDGTFQYGVTLSFTSNVSAIAVKDVNGDGKPDLLVSWGFSVSVLLGNGDGTFHLKETFSEQAASMVLADVNGDGKPDLLATEVIPHTVSVALGNGDGTFHLPVTYDSGGVEPESIAVGDVNGDGIPDLLVANCAPTGYSGCDAFVNGVVGVLLGKGDGTFHAVVKYDAGGPNAQSIAAGSLSGYGRPDLAVTSFFSKSFINVLRNNTGAVTNTAVTTSGSPSFVGQAVTFTATVTSATGPIPDGERMYFYDGTALLGSELLSGGTAAHTTSALSGKTHTIKTAYTGDTTFRLSSGTVKQVVNRYPTTTALTSSPNPSTHGQAVTFTVTVTSTGPNQPTGKVAFKDGTVGIGSATLNGGVATLVKSTLTVGTHPITVEYMGDSSSAKSTSTVLNQVVN